MKSNLWMDPNTCRGCLRCELACSWHHSGNGEFQPNQSSTRVYRNNDTKKITMTLDDSCDRCAEETIPLCIRFCPFHARGITP